MSVKDAVFLLPGFLGFERTGNFSHFADRIASALRGTLEQRLRRAVPIEVITSLPARSLVARQHALLETLAASAEVLGGVERFHLVGYCLGGVDAYLATCARPLQGSSWEDTCSARMNEVRTRISSVTTIASPHLGTCLASAKGAGALSPRGMLRDPGGAVYAAQLLPKLFSSAWSNVDSDDLWHGVVREGRKVAHFAAELRRFQRLLEALTPTAMEALRAQSEPLPGIRRASVVTLTPPVQDTSDPFFAELSKHASGGSTMMYGSHDPTLFSAREAVRAALADPQRLIKSPRVEVPPSVEVTTNDGVVNTCRQLMNPFAPNELLAAVVADHVDVVGYYDRAQGRAKHERELLSGLLRSGSCFRDDEFFALYRKIGDFVAEAAQAAEPASATTEGEGKPVESAVEEKATKRSRSGKQRTSTRGDLVR